MNEDLDNIQPTQIRNYQYAQFFRDVHYNGKVLDAAERMEFISVINETITDYSKGLPMIKHILESIKQRKDEFHEIQRTIVSVMQFTLITMIDSMVISKYFILADKNYDKCFLRGKMKVILNEGFKKLYGFKEGKQSKWNDIGTIMKYFPEEIHRQYQELTSLLEKHSKSSSWWKDERDVETHLDTEKLYASRCEKIKESQVIIDFLKLFETLNAVNLFLTNMHACLNNFLVYKYRHGELQDVKNILCTNEQTTTSSQNMGIGKQDALED